MEEPGEPPMTAAEAKRLLKFRTNLLNMAAHELNTPLTPVQLQMHLLSSGALGRLEPGQEKAVAVVDRNVQRLAMLVRDILDVSRLEAGRLELSLVPTSLHEALIDVEESFFESAKHIGVQLELDLAEECTVMADPIRLTQIVFNLVSNALKFCTSGGHVLVRQRTVPGMACITVQDNGLGIDPENIDDLFRPFARVHDADRNEVPGTGLGLFISRGLVEAMDGSIECKSDGIGHGATFNVYLPLADEDSALGRRRLRSSARPDQALQRRMQELI